MDTILRESSESNNSKRSLVRVIQNQANLIRNNCKTTTDVNKGKTQIQNHIVIQNPRGYVNFGPTYNLTMRQAFTTVDTANKKST